MKGLKDLLLGLELEKKNRRIKLWFGVRMAVFDKIP
jgi:hypothetical protein